MRSQEIEVETGGQPALVDLTDAAHLFVRDGADTEGMLNVFVPHATAGVIVMELGAGSDEDVLATVARLLPRDPERAGWRHRHGAPGHGADHVLPLLASPSISVPVVGGALALGTWQSIVLIDTNVDNRRRRVRFSFLPG
jgi:secondary thiamine-phosphate synthase enzyme